LARREVDHLKPAKFKDHLTIGELCDVVKKDKSWILKLERKGRLPVPRRIRIGDNTIRLYSPQTVEEIKEIFKSMRVGRPRS
jgi:hypothetical protein